MASEVENNYLTAANQVAGHKTYANGICIPEKSADKNNPIDNCQEVSSPETGEICSDSDLGSLGEQDVKRNSSVDQRSVKHKETYDEYVHPDAVQYEKSVLEMHRHKHKKKKKKSKKKKRSRSSEGEYVSDNLHTDEYGITNEYFNNYHRNTVIKEATHSRNSKGKKKRKKSKKERRDLVIRTSREDAYILEDR